MYTCYVAYLKDGTRLDFDKQCDRVNYSDSNFCVFFDDYNKRCIAMIPYENILYILAYKEDEL